MKYLLTESLTISGVKDLFGYSAKFETLGEASLAIDNWKSRLLPPLREKHNWVDSKFEAQWIDSIFETQDTVSYGDDIFVATGVVAGIKYMYSAEIFKYQII